MAGHRRAGHKAGAASRNARLGVRSALMRARAHGRGPARGRSPAHGRPPPPQRRGTIAVTTATMALATVLAVGTTMAASCPARAAANDVEITYSVHLRGDVYADLERFAGMVAATLHDERGWSLGGRIDFRRVPSGGDMRVILASPEAVEAASPACDEAWSCQVGRQVLINELRWDTGTESWKERSRRAYRHYVINHEVGHFLRLGHRHCQQAGGSASVMQQQSISLEGCRTNVWPHLSEIRQVAREQGVPVPRVSPSATDAARVPEQAGAAGRAETLGANGLSAGTGANGLSAGTGADGLSAGTGADAYTQAPSLTSHEPGANPAASLSGAARVSGPVGDCRGGLFQRLARLF